jgi:hypothetical protein
MKNIKNKLHFIVHNFSNFQRLGIKLISSFGSKSSSFVSFNPR